MKKTIFYLVAAMAVLACSKTEEKEVVVEPQKSVYTLYGTIAQETGTKVEISPKEGGGFSHHWQAEDAISVFNTSSGENITYTVTDESVGSSTGTFKGGQEVSDKFYAIYPHNDNNNVVSDNNGLSFTVTYPATQTLTAGSYYPAANVYVATGEGKNLTFYNTTAYLRLALYTTLESATVSKIELSTLDGTKIAGTGTVSLVTQDEITSVGTISISDTGSSDTITLSSTDGISISTSSANPTYFYVAVPAITYGDNFAGYQIKIYSDENTYQFRNFSTGSTAQPLVSNTVRLMSPLEYNPVASDKTATLLIGKDVNEAIKILSGMEPSTTDLYKTNNTYINHIIIETNKNMTGYTGGAGQVTVSAYDSEVPIIASWNSTTKTIRIQTSASKIHTQQCASMFRAFTKLEDITGFENLVIGSGENSGISMSYMFMGDSKLKSLDMSGLTFDYDGTVNVLQLFAFCTSLSSFISPEIRVGDSRSVFQSCSSLTNLNLNGFSTDNVTNMSQMFKGCSSLDNLDLSPLNTSKVTDMSEMFSSCLALKTLDISNFDTEKVTNASNMFYGCSSLTSIDFGVAETSKCTFARCVNCSGMFKNCSTIETISVKTFEISNAKNNGKTVSSTSTQNLSEMFSGCTKLTCLDVPTETGSVAHRWARYVMNTSEMFKNCSSLKNLDISGLMKGSSKNNNQLAVSMFEGCEKLESLTICPSNYNLIKDLSKMFKGCTALNNISFLTYSGGVTDAVFSTTAATSLSEMFYGCKSINNSFISSGFTFSTSNVTDMSYMFNGCKSFTDVDLRGSTTDIFDASLVTDMTKMFYDCTSLGSLILPDGFIGANDVTLTDFVPSGFTNITCSDAFRTNLVKAGILSSN